MVEIPLYRAKSRTTDLEIYGHLFKSQKATFIIPICEYNEEIEEFDFIKVFEPIFEDTLAIHLPNMLASDSDRYLTNDEKDLRIFVSLQEDGKGGDLIEYVDGYVIYNKPDGYAVFYEGGCFFRDSYSGKLRGLVSKDWAKNFKIHGIKE